MNSITRRYAFLHCFRPVSSVRGSWCGSTGDFRRAGTDRILVEEFNDNWDKIDTALKGNADKAAALIRSLPSSFAETMAMQLAQAPGAKPYEEWLAQLNASYGLDLDIVPGFFTWLSKAVVGNFGDSWKWNVPATQKFTEVIGLSVIMGGISFVLSLVIAVPLGVLAATKQYSRADYVITSVALVGISLPTFFFATLLKLLFSGHAVKCLQQLREEGLHHGLLPLLDVILEQPMGERFVWLSLQNTDERVRQDKSVSPGFLFATLLWHEVLAAWERRKVAGEAGQPALF